MHTDNNLAAVNPELVKEWHPTKNEKGPQAYFANSHFKIWWLCKKCSHEWDAQIYNHLFLQTYLCVSLITLLELDLSFFSFSYNLSF
ncbi:zinc-ribbon domain-containing protein [Peribacillus butanolivorans]|uniref:zinc-ribbon domain-containing protein n=1 Tax=Peribacillus butanolivorans TaxID=421767 RepID=UPI0035DF25A4